MIWFEFNLARNDNLQMVRGRGAERGWKFFFLKSRGINLNGWINALHTNADVQFNNSKNGVFIKHATLKLTKAPSHNDSPFSVKFSQEIFSRIWFWLSHTFSPSAPRYRVLWRYLLKVTKIFQEWMEPTSQNWEERENVFWIFNYQNSKTDL